MLLSKDGSYTPLSLYVFKGLWLTETMSQSNRDIGTETLTVTHIHIQTLKADQLGTN
jgi:hypothetical protein